MNVAESQERTELESQGLGTLENLIADEHLVAVLRQDDALAEEDLTDLVGNLRHGIRAEVHHILVAARFVGVSVAVDAEVELLAIHDQALIQVGQQQEAVASEPVQRDCQQAVVAAGVAGHDGRVAVGAGLVGAQDLPLERIGQIDKLRFVEFQKSHRFII